MNRFETNRPYCTPEDLSLEQMVNGHADRRRQSRREAERWTRCLAAVIWSVYLAACIILLWAANLAQAAGFLSPTLGGIVLVALVLGALVSGGQLVVLWKGGPRC